jgi:hypothetical protein
MGTGWRRRDGFGRRRAVTQRRMGSDCIVVDTPALAHDFRRPQTLGPVAAISILEGPHHQTSGLRFWIGTGLSVLLVGVSLASCGGALQIQGSVLDSENRPVVGATIDAAPLSTFSEWSARFPAQSNGDGCFALAGTVSPFPTRQAPLTVSAPGYKPVTAEMQSPSSNRVIVTLARKDSSEQAASSSSCGKIACLLVLPDRCIL